jgi:GNAT superfamily N-acetyltransferase
MTTIDLPARPAASSVRGGGYDASGHGATPGPVRTMAEQPADVTGLRIRAAEPADRSGVAALLRGLSPESTYRRFQTGLGPDPRAVLLDALLPEDLQGSAVVAHLGRPLVGHGVWRRVGATSVAEIGLIVADAYQGQGLGTALAAALLDDLAARGLDTVEVFTSASHQAVIRMVTRFAPNAARERDGATVTYRFRATVSATRTVA